MAKLIYQGAPVTAGERKMLIHLQTQLPDNYIVFGNPLVNLGPIVRELDAIVLTPESRLYVIESKHLRGEVTGDEETWVVNGKTLPGVINKLLHNAAILKAKIVDRFPQLIDLRVGAAVVLTSNEVTLKVEDERVSHIAVRLAETKKFFTKNFIKGRLLSTGEIDNVVRALFGDIQFESIKGSLHQSKIAPMVSPSPNTRQFYIRLTGPNGFQRTYFDDIVLCRNEFRGLSGWENLEGSLLSLRFGQNHAIELSAITDAIEVDSQPVAPGGSVVLRGGNCTFEVGGIRLNANIVNDGFA